MDTIFILYGLLMVIILLGVTLYCYNPKAKTRVEQAKFVMMDDEVPLSDKNHGQSS